MRPAEETAISLMQIIVGEGKESLGQRTQCIEKLINKMFFAYGFESYIG
jgi:hypothetical protein